MHFRTIILTLIVVAIAVLAALNWNTLAAPTAVSLGVSSVEAPLGLIMLALTVLLAIFFVAYVLTLQGSVLMETRRHAKEMAAQRELADRAEASRFTELREVLENQHRAWQDTLLARLETMEARLMARARESENVTAAYVGQLEDQLHAHSRVASDRKEPGLL